MENKLGINQYRLMDIEKEIVNLKLNLLDEYFTFNQSLFDFEYLKKLHNFLFSDLYYDYQLETRDFTEIEENNIKFLFENIENICIKHPNNIEGLLKCIHDIWYLQPFYNGNTRTMIAYLKVLNNAFLLDLNIDLDKEVISKPSTFDINNFVNQKRLTKIK